MFFNYEKSYLLGDRGQRRILIRYGVLNSAYFAIIVVKGANVVYRNIFEDRKNVEVFVLR